MEASKGQSLLEFVTCFCLISAATTSAFGVLYHQWVRLRCSVHVFEAAHARNVGGVYLYGDGVSIAKTKNGVQAQGRCGGTVEKVNLPELELARW
jgi:hypothetical protein